MQASVEPSWARKKGNGYGITKDHPVIRLGFSVNDILSLSPSLSLEASKCKVKGRVFVSHPVSKSLGNENLLYIYSRNGTVGWNKSMEWEGKLFFKIYYALN